MQLCLGLPLETWQTTLLANHDANSLRVSMHSANITTSIAQHGRTNDC